MWANKHVSCHEIFFFSLFLTNFFLFLETLDHKTNLQQFMLTDEIPRGFKLKSENMSWIFVKKLQKVSSVSD